MSGPGYNDVFSAVGGPRDYDARRRNRVVLVRWNDGPTELTDIFSAYSGEAIQFPVEELDELITLLQQAKAALAGLTDSGAAAPSPAAVAPVAPQENEGPSAVAATEGR